MREKLILFQWSGAIISRHFEDAALPRSRGLNDFLRINSRKYMPARVPLTMQRFTIVAQPRAATIRLPQGGPETVTDDPMLVLLSSLVFVYTNERFRGVRSGSRVAAVSVNEDQRDRAFREYPDCTRASAGLSEASPRGRSSVARATTITDWRLAFEQVAPRPFRACPRKEKQDAACTY